MKPAILRKGVRKIFATSSEECAGASAEQVTEEIIEIISSMEIYAKYPSLHTLMKNFKIINISFDGSGGNADDRTEETEAEFIVDEETHSLHYSRMDNWSYGESRASLYWRGVNILKEMETIKDTALDNFCQCSLALKLGDLSIAEVTEFFIMLLSPIAQTKYFSSNEYHPFKTALDEIISARDYSKEVPIKDLGSAQDQPEPPSSLEAKLHNSVG